MVNQPPAWSIAVHVTLNAIAIDIVSKQDSRARRALASSPGDSYFEIDRRHAQ
jgi:hypothetical protein